MRKKKISDFFRKEYQKLLAFAKTWLDDTAERDAEDIIQDVALSIFNRADISLPIESLSAYVYRAVKNRIIDYFRKKKSNISLDEEFLVKGNPEFTNLLQDIHYDSVSEMEKAEIREYLFKALESLNAKDRAIIVANEFEGVPFRILADNWGVPIGTLLTRKTRALKKLKRELAHLI